MELAHPRFGVEKLYRVVVAGSPTREVLNQLVEGIWLAEGKVRALEHWRSTRPDKYTFVDAPAADWESSAQSVVDIVSRLTGDPGYDEVVARQFSQFWADA